MKRIIFLIFCLQISAILMAQAVRQKNNQRIKVSNDKRSFVYEDGSPFFWLGDTGWELFHRLNKEEVEHYFKTRSAQGFTVIQCVALAELDGLHKPNAYGQIPLINDDPATPNSAYFDHVEWVIDKARDYGLVLALLPTWGDKVYKDRWGTGPEIFNRANAEVYGKWIANRFKEKTNIIWVLGGDRNPRNESDVNIWRAMGSGIEQGIGNHHAPLISFHPQPSETSSSSTWFHTDSWLDFNMLQTGHCRDIKVWDKISRDYQLQPFKPTVNGEPIYEDHPVCFNAKQLGYTNAYDVRKAVYLSVLAGAAGVTYGCHAMWQFYEPPREGVNGPLKPWKESLNLPGASQMQYLKKLIKEFPLLKSSPYQEILSDTLDGTKRIQALKTVKGVIIYTAGGEIIRLQKTGSNQPRFKSGFWYDPRTGTKTIISNLAKRNSNSFSPPSQGDNNDWVLVLK